MPERSTSARKTSSEARDEFLQRAERLWDEFNAWYQDHPEATFDEMEAELGKRRRAVLGSFLELSLRQGNLGATPDDPACESCGKPMTFKGYPKKAVHGVEADIKIPRAYYVCPSCGTGLFPPGPTSTAEEG
jgi:hypothetical protein